MAYRFVDPAPFMPDWRQRVMVPGHPAMHRVVTGRVQRCNKDVAIAFINPMPQGQLDFDVIRETLSQFLHVQMRMPTQSIQPCPYGQAYVTFSHMSHRDFLINNGPRQFGNVHISFTTHDRAWNNRTTIFTHEVWLLLIGLNLDLWSYSLVEKAVSQFGKLIVWEEDHNYMGRTLVKARVSALDAVPWFMNFSEGEDPESDSWTVQTEIIMTRMLGAVPQDEDFPPKDLDDVDPNHFHFHGFGQPGQGPPAPDNEPGPDAHAPNQFNADLANPAWAPWGGQNAGSQVAANLVGAEVNTPQPQFQPEVPPEMQVVQAAKPDPLPAIEEVVQAQDNENQLLEEAVIDQDEVLAMDEATDSDDEFN